MTFTWKMVVPQTVVVKQETWKMVVPRTVVVKQEMVEQECGNDRDVSKCKRPCLEPKDRVCVRER